jgi:hypothetical protein
VLVTVAERLPHVGGEPLEAEPEGLGTEILAREMRLHLRREAELDGRVLDLLQVSDRIAGHARNLYQPPLA